MGELTHLLARIPHRGPMCFIDDVLAVGPSSVETTMTLRADHILAVDGVLSPIAAIELFAQSAAVLMSHRTSGSDPNPVAGALLGTRGVDFVVPELRVGDVLRVVRDGGKVFVRGIGSTPIEVTSEALAIAQIDRIAAASRGEKP